MRKTQVSIAKTSLFLCYHRRSIEVRPPRSEGAAMRPGSFVNLATAFLLAAALPSSTAVAQGKYPDRPIRIVVGFAAGGPTDVMARKLAAKIGPTLGQSVVVDNKPGASATIAIAEVAKSKPDGYTLYFGDSGAFAITALTLPNLPYDVTRDFDPVAMFAA